MRQVMRMGMAVTLVAGVAALASYSGVAAKPLAQAPPAFKRTTLQQADLSVPGRQAVTALAELQPGAAAGKHTHPGEEIGYVLQGPVVVDIEGTAKTVQTGEAFFIPAGKVHDAINRGTGVVKIVATYVVEKDKPVATPVQ